MALDYAALKIEIAKPIYVGMTDAQIAAAVDAQTVSVTSTFSTEVLARYLDVQGKLAGILRVARSQIALTASAADKALADAAIWFDYAITTAKSFDLTIPGYPASISAKLDAAITAGLIVAADKTAIINLAQRPQQKWSGKISYIDIAIARAS